MRQSTWTSPAFDRAVRCALCLVFVGLAAGCNALDRGRLQLQPRSDAGGANPTPDGGEMLDGSVQLDSSVPFDGSTPLDSSTPIDSSMPFDGGMTTDAGRDAGAEDAGEEAAVDAGCQSLECMDLCPDDANKTAPGACGCGVAETTAAECAALRSALRHRYRFGGTGTIATDDVADADGTVMNATLDGSGSLTLAGGTSNQYVELPQGIISMLTDATFEAWVTWQGGGGWQRIFDFGNSSGSNGETYVFVTPQRGGGTAALRATMSLSGTATEVIVDGSAALPTGSMHHVALVVDDLVDLRLYVDGVLQTTTANTTRSLGGLNDVQNWLGRSLYSADPEFGGSFQEFRIYGAALTASQLAASAALGPDPVFLE